MEILPLMWKCNPFKFFLVFFFSLPRCMAFVILIPWPELNLGPQQWECRVLTTGPLGNSLAAAAATPLQSCPTLCDPLDGSPPGSPIPGILQGRTLEWGAISFSNAWKWKVKVKLLSCVRLLVDPMDCSLPGSSVHGIFQARVLEWGATAFSEGIPLFVV